jgi:hypothetical protein
MIDLESNIQRQYSLIARLYNERDRRIWAGCTAQNIGHGGIAIVYRATGISPKTIKKGIDEINSQEVNSEDRIREHGGGRKPAETIQPELISTLESMIDPLTRGDPESPLRWTSKSTRHLAKELNALGFQVSHWLVDKILHDLGYSLKGNQKVLEGSQHPLRNSQFEFINKVTKRMIKQGNTVISVDTKKKEVLGNFANKGKEWEPKGEPVKVNSHDFPSPDLPRANPYGVLDLNNNQGFVNVGTTHDTPCFAVASIKAWWYEIGYKQNTNLNHLLITADCGGSNSYRSRAWKWHLQLLSDEINIPISVCHFPPGTSKWNKIEHRLFSYISMNWRAKPLTDYVTMVSLIQETKTETGLSVACVLDESTYNLGETITKDSFDSINIKRNNFQGDWNYTISPRKSKS